MMNIKLLEVEEEMLSYIYEVHRENSENLRRLQLLIKQMFKMLEIYLVSQKNQNTQRLKEIRESAYYEPIHKLQAEFFIDNPLYLEKFNEIAKKYNYLFKGDIQEIANMLTTSIAVDKKIEKCKNHSFINNIEQVEENTFTIESEFGEFSFKNARKTYKKETKRMLEEAKKYDEEQYNESNLRYHCHLTALEFIKMHEEYYLISSICPHMFSSTWWFHSYILTPDENTVIDFATNIIMERKMFEKLFEPNNLVKIRREDLDRIREEQEIIEYFGPHSQLERLINYTIIERAKQLQKRNTKL